MCSYCFHGVKSDLDKEENKQNDNQKELRLDSQDLDLYRVLLFYLNFQITGDVDSNRIKMTDNLQKFF